MNETPPIAVSRPSTLAVWPAALLPGPLIGGLTLLPASQIAPAGAAVLLGAVPILPVGREPGDRMRAPAVMAVLSPLWGTLLYAAWHGVHLTRDVF